MQNLLKSCDLEQFRSLFQEKNIDLASLRLLVDDQASTQVKQRVQKALIDDCGLQLLDVLKICDRLHDSQPLHSLAQKSVSPIRGGRQKAQNASRTTHTGYQFRGGNKRVQALLGGPKPSNSKPMTNPDTINLRATTTPPRSHQANPRENSENKNQGSLLFGQTTRPNLFKPMAATQSSGQSDKLIQAKREDRLTTQQLFRDALGRAPLSQQAQSITAPPQKAEADLPPKTEANSQVGLESLKGNQVVKVDEKEIDGQPLCHQTQVKHVQSQPEANVNSSTHQDAPKSFEELNKPMDYQKNQDEVAQKLNQFRANNIEQFGSSQVPTPAVKDIYKQCAGGMSSDQVMASNDGEKDHDLASQTHSEANQQPREPNVAVCETRQPAGTTIVTVPAEKNEIIATSSFQEIDQAVQADAVPSAAEVINDSQQSQVNELSSNVQSIVQQVTIDARLSSQEPSHQETVVISHTVTKEAPECKIYSAAQQQQDLVDDEVSEQAEEIEQIEIEVSEDNQEQQQSKQQEDCEQFSQKWDEVMTQIDGAKRVASEASAQSSKENNPTENHQEHQIQNDPPEFEEALPKTQQQFQQPCVGVQEEEENSYIEPSYDDHDQSESYEPTYHVKKSASINQLVSDNESGVPQQQEQQEVVGRPESDGESVDNYECTHDQQLSEDNFEEGDDSDGDAGVAHFANSNNVMESGQYGGDELMQDFAPEQEREQQYEDQDSSSEQDQAHTSQQQIDSAQVNLYEQRFMQVQPEQHQQQELQQQVQKQENSDCDDSSEELDFHSGRQGSQVMNGSPQTTRAQQQSLWMTGRQCSPPQQQQAQPNNVNVSEDESSSSSQSSEEDQEDQNMHVDGQVMHEQQQFIQEQPNTNPQNSQPHQNQYQAVIIEDANDDSDNDDTSSEGREAIETTRVADEQLMVVVSDKDCTKQITLCEMGTQTEPQETVSVAVTAKPPTPTGVQTQTHVVRLSETATQMSPPVKQSTVELYQEQSEEPKPVALEPIVSKPVVSDPVASEPVVEVVNYEPLQTEVKEQAELQVKIKQESNNSFQQEQGPSEQVVQKEKLVQVQNNTIENEPMQEMSPEIKKTISPITKQFLAESKKTTISQRTEKLLNGANNIQVDDEPLIQKPSNSYTSPTPKNQPVPIEQKLKVQQSPVKQRAVFDSPSKIIAQKKRDLNKPFQSKIDKKALLIQQQVQSSQGSSTVMPPSQLSHQSTSLVQSTPSTASKMLLSANVTVAATPDNGSLSLHKINSSSVTSSIAEFIPMRSIMKPQENTSSSLKKEDQMTVVDPAKPGSLLGVKKRKKTVRFDDMILIGDDSNQVQIFLSDEEASIVDKKSTPTKLNLQSSAELRKRIKKDRLEKLAARREAQRMEQQQMSTKAPKELTLDNVLEQNSKRRRTQTNHYGYRGADNSDQKQNTQTSSPEITGANDQEHSEGSSPDKNDMSLDFECSYDGDSDMGSRSSSQSKLKRRRNKKKRRKSQSPDKTQRKGSGQQQQRGYDDIDDIEDENSHDSQAEQARRVAEVIKGHQQRKPKHTSQSASKSAAYQPSEQTRKGMSSTHQARLQESIASLLYPSKSKTK